MPPSCKQAAFGQKSSRAEPSQLVVSHQSKTKTPEIRDFCGFRHHYIGPSKIGLSSSACVATLRALTDFPVVFPFCFVRNFHSCDATGRWTAAWFGLEIKPTAPARLRVRVQLQVELSRTRLKPYPSPEIGAERAVDRVRLFSFTISTCASGFWKVFYV